MSSTIDPDSAASHSTSAAGSLAPGLEVNFSLDSSDPADKFPAAELPVLADLQDDFLDEEEDDDESPAWFNGENYALVASLLAHVAFVLILALLPQWKEEEPSSVVLLSSVPDFEPELVQQIEEVVYSETPIEDAGASSLAESSMAAASATEFSEVVQIPNPVDQRPQELATINLDNLFAEAAAPLDLNVKVKGKVGQAIEGATGAVDRLTFEILKSLEERPTLVVWLFDQSGSLTRQRAEIRDRFDRIYNELGLIQESGNEAFKNRGDEAPLLTSIMGFGDSVQLLTKEPTADLDVIKATVDSIENDPSGVEKVFSAVFTAANQYKDYRRSRPVTGPARNVLLFVVTDERGDDSNGLEPTIAVCRKLGMPVYVIGVPAPFGREHTLIKYVDPDPAFDQSPQFAQVDQGPESLRPERVNIGYLGSFQREPVIDSGFGPFALTRLAFETGGIFFTVHPNRNMDRRVSRNELEDFASEIEYFVDPNIMSRYRPDYVSPKDYETQLRKNQLRAALVAAGQMSEVATLETPRTRFVKRDDAQLAGELSRAQQSAAIIEPRLIALDELLRRGELGRKSESSPRWLAGFDLARGRVLAHKVRAETYNAMLAKAKRGMVFTDPKNNTWQLEPSDDVSVGSKWEREAEEARELLKNVLANHAGTPWALLAEAELQTPIGWAWKEDYTDLDPPGRDMGGNNNPAPPPSDDVARMIERKPVRQVPKL